MIEIRGLGKAYPTRNAVFEALRGVDLEVAKGEIFGIIGRSGAGKSTLLRMINLLERPTSGRILVDGVDVTDLDGEPLRCLRQRVGIIFQHFNLSLGLTIVLITQGMDVIRAVADRVAILDRGSVVESGKVVEVFLNPRNAVTRARPDNVHSPAIQKLVAALRSPGAKQFVKDTYHGAVLTTF